MTIKKLLFITSILCLLSAIFSYGIFYLVAYNRTSFLNRHTENIKNNIPLPPGELKPIYYAGQGAEFSGDYWSMSMKIYPADRQKTINFYYDFFKNRPNTKSIMYTKRDDTEIVGFTVSCRENTNLSLGGNEDISISSQPELNSVSIVIKSPDVCGF